jgi:hypothetical protein
MGDWKKDLSRYFEGSAAKDQQDQVRLAKDRDTAAQFYASVVAPAFDDLKTELEKYGRTVHISLGRDSGSITVEHEGEAAY